MQKRGELGGGGGRRLEWSGGCHNTAKSVPLSGAKFGIWECDTTEDKENKPSSFCHGTTAELSANRCLTTSTGTAKRKLLYEGGF